MSLGVQIRTCYLLRFDSVYNFIISKNEINSNVKISNLTRKGPKLCRHVIWTHQWPCYVLPPFSFGGKYDLIQLHFQMQKNIGFCIPQTSNIITILPQCRKKADTPHLLKEIFVKPPQFEPALPLVQFDAFIQTTQSWTKSGDTKVYKNEIKSSLKKMT